MGEKISAGLQALQDDGMIESFDGVGAIWGAELARDAVPVRNHMLHENGVVVRPVYTRIAMCPPLILTDDEIARMLDALADGLTATL